MSVIVHFGLNQSLLVLRHDLLREEFTAIAASLTAQDLIVFRELYLVVIDRLSQILSHWIAIFDVMQLLEAVDGDGEDLTGWLEHRATLSLKLLNISLTNLLLRITQVAARLRWLVVRLLLRDNFIFDELTVEDGHLSQILLVAGYTIHFQNIEKIIRMVLACSRRSGIACGLSGWFWSWLPGCSFGLIIENFSPYFMFEHLSWVF